MRIEVLISCMHENDHSIVERTNIQTDVVVVNQTEMNLSEVFSFYNPSDNILKEYQHADVLCLPSIREGYPNVVIEAMSCELPVLCSNVCENPIIVQDGVNGFLFNPYDVNDMVRALESYFKISFEYRYAMGQRNRKKVVENNSMESFVNKYIVLFNQI